MTVTGRTRDFVIFLDKLILSLAKHWLLAINIATGLYAGLPVLAPILMRGGITWAGKLIYTIYAPLCHQLPHRSFFLFGAQFSYSEAEIISALGENYPLRYIGDAVLGYKIAYCERDTAIYTTFLIAGILFTLVRTRLKPLKWQYFMLFMVPMFLDGTIQMISDVTLQLGYTPFFGIYVSTSLRRVVTGALFGLACVWLVYPYLEIGFRDIRATVEHKFRKAGISG